MTGTRSARVRLIEIAEHLGVTHQRTFVIVRQPGFPAPVGRVGRSRMGSARGHGVGEAAASREAVAITRVARGRNRPATATTASSYAEDAIVR